MEAIGPKPVPLPFLYSIKIIEIIKFFAIEEKYKCVL